MNMSQDNFTESELFKTIAKATEDYVMPGVGLIGFLCDILVLIVLYKSSRIKRIFYKYLSIIISIDAIINFINVFSAYKICPFCYNSASESYFASFFSLYISAQVKNTLRSICVYVLVFLLKHNLDNMSNRRLFYINMNGIILVFILFILFSLLSIPGFFISSIVETIISGIIFYEIEVNNFVSEYIIILTLLRTMIPLVLLIFFTVRLKMKIYKLHSNKNYKVFNKIIIKFVYLFMIRTVLQISLNIFLTFSDTSGKGNIIKLNFIINIFRFLIGLCPFLHLFILFFYDEKILKLDKSRIVK